MILILISLVIIFLDFNTIDELNLTSVHICYLRLSFMKDRIINSIDSKKIWKFLRIQK